MLSLLPNFRHRHRLAGQSDGRKLPREKRLAQIFNQARIPGTLLIKEMIRDGSGAELDGAEGSPAPQKIGKVAEKGSGGRLDLEEKVRAHPSRRRAKRSPACQELAQIPGKDLPSGLIVGEKGGRLSRYWCHRFVCAR